GLLVDAGAGGGVPARTDRPQRAPDRAGTHRPSVARAPSPRADRQPDRRRRDAPADDADADRRHAGADPDPHQPRLATTGAGWVYRDEPPVDPLPRSRRAGGDVRFRSELFPPRRVSDAIGAARLT